jgi:predicted ribosome quality control (RQC) complex YloA/Tae2 family protein
MKDQILKAIIDEISPLITGRFIGKVFQLTRTTLVIDFRTSDKRYLLISVDPTQSRIYLIARSIRELEKDSINSSSFVLAIRKNLSSASLRSVKKDEDDRIVRFSFDGRDLLGNPQSFFLIAQLTGRASNLFLCDKDYRIIDALRETFGKGQETGTLYQPPQQTSQKQVDSSLPFAKGKFASLSEAADNYYTQLEATRTFNTRATTALARIRKAIDKNLKLQENLNRDLNTHGDAEYHRRIGELLLSNIGTAQRDGSIVKIKDYYSEDLPTIELNIDENLSLQEEANRYFTRYTKAKRAAQEITRRLDELKTELQKLELQRKEIERIIADKNIVALNELENPKDNRPVNKSNQKKQKQGKNQKIQGVRKYLSSDGYQILVGRGAQDNDRLTFQVASPHDTWLHAANYPGSHVIVRNHGRAEIPHRTIVEAAQLAAYYSQARSDSKVDVHYTQRKFISKPKGAAPGLVRMSSFRTLIVEPRESVERIMDEK